MRIISKACYLFRNKENSDTFKTSPLAIQDVPEWVKDDLTFINALKSGNIQVFEKQQTKAVETKQENVSGTIVQQIEQFNNEITPNIETTVDDTKTENNHLLSNILDFTNHEE